MNYTFIYEPNGFIVSMIIDPIQPVELEPSSPFLVLLLESEDVFTPDTNYIDAGVVRQTQDFPEVTQAVVNANGEYTITLTNIPAETSVTWSDGFISEENDGTLECVVAFPDEYRFLLENVRHFTREVVVNV